MIGGLYLILGGLARFVEEAYRGEPQTPIRAGLRIYQWMALGSVVAGAVITAVGRSAPAPEAEFNASSLLVALGFGVVTWVALGVDFPTRIGGFPGWREGQPPAPFPPSTPGVGRLCCNRAEAGRP